MASDSIKESKSPEIVAKESKKEKKSKKKSKDGERTDDPNHEAIITEEARQEKREKKRSKKNKNAELEEAIEESKENPKTETEEKKEKNKQKKKKEKKRKHEEESDKTASKKSKSSKSEIDSKSEKKKQEKPKAAGLSTNSEWYSQNNITVEDQLNQSWKPILKFSESGLDEKVLHITRDYEKPTPIQSACIPIALKGRHLIGIAETGSGKTMTFGIPALAHLQKAPKRKQPTVLVLAPTRELALQIWEQFEKASELCQFKSMVIYGGTPKDEQRQKLRKGIQIVIACPGRLLDLVQEGSCKLDQVDYVILDEADRMLDMGFEKEVRQIIGMTAGTRQILMFSATWPTSIQKLAHEFLRQPVKVTVGSEDLTANQNITQIVEVVDQYEKENKVIQLLNKYHSSRKNRVLVFALYKKEAARLEQILQRRGWNCTAIHGDMSQPARNNSFSKFRNGECPLLIATDVAARGLDIPSVEYVINYTFPLTIEDYVHRIGRTGRAGKKGVSHTFFTMHDKLRAGELVNLLKQANQEVPEQLLAFGTTVKKKEHAAYGAFFKEVDENVKGTKITFESDDE